MATLGSSFGDVHAAILRQHKEIRARLCGLDAGALPGGLAHEGTLLRVSLFRLAIVFESHLQYEELELAPRLRQLDAGGPAREAALHHEHAEQRTRLEHVCFLAEDEGTSDAILEREVSKLVIRLLEDMAQEELELSELERLSSDDFADQMMG